MSFFATYRQLYPVSRDVQRGAAEQFQCWVKDQADKWNAPIVEAPKGRRDEFVDAYFKAAKPDQVVTSGLPTDGFGDPVFDFASRRCGRSGGFTIAANLM